MSNTTVSGDQNGEKESESFSCANPYFVNSMDDGIIESELFYPQNQETDYGSRIKFDIFEIDPPKVKGNISPADALRSVGDAFKKTVEKIFTGDSDINSSAIIGAAKGVIDESNASLTIMEKHPIDKKIMIYLPVGFSSSDTLNYESPQLGILGAGMESSLNSGAGLVGAGKRGLSDLVSSFSASVSGDAASLGIARLTNALPIPSEMKLGTTSALRVTTDPNIRTLFKGVGVRSFQFSFKFISKSPEESKMIENIIKRFRFYAYPESIPLGQLKAGFKFPNPFRIRVESKDDSGKYVTVGHDILDSYLTTINTNYNASSMSFHSDGKPVEIDLSLTFTEETTLDKKDIKDGY